MKKIFFIILCVFPSFVFADLVNYSPSAVLYEPTTNKVLYNHNMNEKRPPASMTKIMTMLLIMEAIDEEKISLDDMVIVSDNAANMGGSQVFLQAGMELKLSELLKAVSIASGNDAAVALAEYLYGTTDEFVLHMNEKVNELGLENTHFMNVHGLDSQDHYSSSYDMAIIAAELLKYPKILEYSSLYEDYLNKPDGTKTWLVNTNKMVRYYSGVDGLKTGFTSNAKYCLTATGTKNNIRLISVVMGSDTAEHRTYDTTSLLNYGFSNFKLNTIVEDHEIITNSQVYKGTVESVDIITTDYVTDLISNNEKKSYEYKYNIDKLFAPIKVGDVVGNLEVIDNNGVLIKEIKLTVKENIYKQNFGSLFIKIFKKIICGN